MASEAIRVRFAPSPTGYLHVGGARTALFNWLFARRFGGAFILRIEDTDFERSTTEMVEGILLGMKWLGLDWDEGPYYQSQRLPLYRQTAEKLLASGHAYYCFCSKELLEQERAAAQAEGRLSRCGCRAIPREEAAQRKANGEAATVRFTVPESGSTVFEDAVFGKVEFSNAELEDFVLLRSDGIPTYHLSVVSDDAEMKITHIIRGADHLSNTPKQVLLYRALAEPLPVFAHVPLILGPDKTRLSKRHGATSVMAYREEGILPQAFRNFLVLLGWSPPDSTKEIMDDQKLISLFSLEGISRSDAVFDRAKLDWFNMEYIRSYPAERLLPHIEEEWRKSGVEMESRDAEWLYATIDLVKPRARNFRDFATSFRAFFTDSYQSDPAAVAKFLSDESVREMLVVLAERYAAEAEFTEAGVEKILRDYAAERNVKAGALINGARVALTGQGVAPSLFTVMVALGKERTVRRLRAASSLVPAA